MVKVKWASSATKELREFYNYVRNTSPQTAKVLVSDIRSHANYIAEHPEIRPLDKYKKDNDGTHRYFEMYRLRVSYKIIQDGILVTRVRSTRQKPLKH